MATELGPGCRSSTSIRGVSPLGFVEITFSLLTRSFLQISKTTTFVRTQEGFCKRTRAPSDLPPHISALFSTTSQIRCHIDRSSILFVLLMGGPTRFTHTRPLSRSLVRFTVGREWCRRRFGKRTRSPCKMGVPKMRRYCMGEDKFHEQ